jgi:RNA polymerase sigma-70 factor (ECF subfamily)
MDATVELTAGTGDLLAEDLESGFVELVRRHATPVRTFLLRVSGSAAVADDLGQDTFLKAYTALRGYSAERRRALRPRSWLLAIAANTWRNHVRTATRHPVAPFPAEESCTTWPDGDPGPEERAANALDRGVLTAALLQLPEQQRTAVVLRHVIGMSYQEAAEVVGCPVGTVKAQVSRGLARLRGIVPPDTAEAQEVTRP